MGTNLNYESQYINGPIKKKSPIFFEKIVDLYTEM
jgi:hypothetical protein